MIKELKNRVKHILETYPLSKDDDKLLIWKVWEFELGIDLVYLDYATFLGVSSPESIRRCRQQLQQMDVSLRGNSYDKRHNKNEPEVRKEVNNEKWKEIEKINEERLKKHSKVYQDIYKSTNIAKEDKNRALEDILRMEEDNNYANRVCFDKTETLLTAFDWSISINHSNFWTNIFKQL